MAHIKNTEQEKALRSAVLLYTNQGIGAEVHALRFFLFDFFRAQIGC